MEGTVGNGLTRRGGSAEFENSPDGSSCDSGNEGEDKDDRSRRRYPLWVQVLLCIAIGFVFGFAMEKGRVFEPRAIRHQMVFKKMIMLKMFVSALATGMFGLSVLAMVPRTHPRFFLTCNQYYSDLRDKGVLSSVLGGIILGVGIPIAGTCPSAIFAQVGAMTQNSSYTICGALGGALAYGVLKPLIDKISRPLIEESSNPWVTSPYFIMALPLAAMFGIVVCSFELLVPWTKDVKMKAPDAPWPELKAWPPYVAGMLIGGLQVPLMLVLGQTLGGSTSFTVALAQLLRGPLRRLSPYIAAHRWGFHVWWQVVFAAGAAAGAYSSASLSGHLGAAKGVPPAHALLGGFLVIFGARVAGGCTSGHGLSGMSLLSILSVITTACMFSAAIATGYAMNAMDIYKVI